MEIWKEAVRRAIGPKITFLSVGNLIDFKYAAAANDEAKISSCSSKSCNLKNQKSQLRPNKPLMPSQWTLLIRNKAPTSVTLRPRLSNFFPYCFLDLVELLVTNTKRLPCILNQHNKDEKHLDYCNERRYYKM